MNPKLAGISSLGLLDELSRRMIALEHGAKQARSVARLRETLDLAFKAGASAGKLAQLVSLQDRLRHILDEAVANAPDPVDGEQRDERDYRRALWLAIEKALGDIASLARAETGTAGLLRARFELLADEALRPALPLRARVGSWLYTVGARLAQRKAAA